MARIEQIAAEYGIAVEEITLWVKEGWVLPRGLPEAPSACEFDSADIARLRLIADLAHDMGIGREALPVVLHLIDQIHALRRRMSRLSAALDAMPEENRAELLSILMRESD